MSKRLLKWGILATGKIAEKFAKGLADSKTGRLVAVGSRNAETSRPFAKTHGIAPEHAHGSYEALLADPEVEVVYIATPHPMHLEWVVKTARAKKHILCEKPLGINLAQGEKMVAAARENGVLLMEAFMYRCHPQTAKIVELVRNGTLGQVGLVQAAFGFNQPFDPHSRLWNNALGGGGILDVGCYPVSFSRLVAGAVEGKGNAYANPIEVSGAGAKHPQTGVDMWAAATLKFESGMVAQVSTGVGLQQDNVARIYGTKGWLHVVEPWVPTRHDKRAARMWFHPAGEAAGKASAEEIVIPFQAGEYTLEADAVATALEAGKLETPQMSTGDTLGNLKVLERWLDIVGVKYKTA